jgi:hypothetical protein
MIPWARSSRVRSGAQYPESLRDGRQVVIDGQVVKDVRTYSYTNDDFTEALALVEHCLGDYDLGTV